ncbi:hypothetical protein JHK82_048920 [Glycine max]|uniref:Uncharacterized protein n=1 Tax=Glycine max TaxID=3847 RepID=A0A0R0FSF3_SOYBN|nr:hypothetical protein JHK85_049418 [Glycine max]KAG5099066.1 hypothetical protein JHK82_048920 [Glycine max]KAH1120207.1 hypothetical protein GYH30_048524 [Glycine max]
MNIKCCMTLILISTECPNGPHFFNGNKNSHATSTVKWLPGSSLARITLSLMENSMRKLMVRTTLASWTIMGGICCCCSHHRSHSRFITYSSSGEKKNSSRKKKRNEMVLKLTDHLMFLSIQDK